MANKFQLSVLERLEQEAARQQQPESAPKRSKEKANTDTQKKEPAGENFPGEREAPAPATFSGAAVRIEDYLRREPQRRAKNKTFYLDAQVIDAIKATAIAQEVTDSKLVNDILRRVLGV